MSYKAALAIAINILSNFRYCDDYEDVRDDELITDEEYKEVINTLVDLKSMPL